jgi:hypothetical protein
MHFTQGTQLQGTDTPCGSNKHRPLSPAIQHEAEHLPHKITLRQLPEQHRQRQPFPTTATPNHQPNFSSSQRS